jgi:hypothetical protein
MTDIILVATIVAFFVAGALLVRVLDHMITSSGSDADPGDEADEASPPEAGSGRLA